MCDGYLQRRTTINYGSIIKLGARLINRIHKQKMTWKNSKITKSNQSQNYESTSHSHHQQAI